MESERTVFLLLVATACTTLPLTQRRQIIFTNEQEEMALAEVQYRQLLDKIDVNYDPGANRISEDGRATARQSSGGDELSVGVRRY